MLAELPDDSRPITEFAYHTGWLVRSESLPLEWSQVDFAAGTVRLEPNTTKNTEGRTYPFGAVAALVTLLEAQRTRTREVELRTGQRVRWVFHRNG